MSTRWNDLEPHVSSYRATPYTDLEVDNHSDCARIWATIVEVRDEIREQTDDEYASVYKEQDDSFTIQMEEEQEKYHLLEKEYEDHIKRIRNKLNKVYNILYGDEWDEELEKMLNDLEDKIMR